MKELTEIYEQQRANFLDSLQPDDLRNGESFNQIGDIIDKINKACCQAIMNKESSKEFIKKAAENLFREDSPAIKKAINLSNAYLGMMIK